MSRDPQNPRELSPTPLLEWLRGAVRQALAASDLADERGRQRMVLVLGDYVTALGDALNRYAGATGPLDRERFGREEAGQFLAMLTGAEAARAARIKEPHLRVVPPLGTPMSEPRKTRSHRPYPATRSGLG